MNILLVGDQEFYRPVIEGVGPSNQPNTSISNNSIIDIEEVKEEVEAFYLSKEKEINELLSKNLSDLNFNIVIMGKGVSDLICKQIFSKFLESGDGPVFIWISNLTHEEICANKFYTHNLFNKFLPLTGIELKKLLSDALIATFEELKRDNLIKYSKVNIDRLIDHNYINCDLYLKLSSVKLVKIVNANEMFTQEVIEKYKRKGIKHLYVRAEDYMSFTEFSYKSIRSKYSVTNDISSENLQNKVELGKECACIVQEMFANMKVTTETARILNEIASDSVKLVKKNPELSLLIDNLYRKQGYIWAHSLLISYISGLIALKMTWNTTATLQKLSIAAITHDATLEEDHLAKVEDIHQVDYEKISWKNLEKIKKHPLEVKELLDRVGKLLPDVSTIILMHHEKYDGSGFPRGLSGDQFSQIGCLFILAEDFVNNIYGQHFGPSLAQKLISNFQKKYNHGNFRRPYEGMVKMLSEEN